MKMHRLIVLIFFVAATLASHAQDEQQTELDTAVLSGKDTHTETFDWGSLTVYFSGQSWSSRDALSGVVILNPGMEAHPPHEHSEEEYLMILEGEGVWTVQGKDFPAQSGDMLYAAPWDVHGVKNTGKTPLRFVFFKWNPKPVEPMEKPKAQE